MPVWNMFHTICLLVASVIFSCHAGPMTAQSGGPTIAFSPLGIDHLIVGGVNAMPGAWPWQLSLQTLYTSGWSHICGACLLSPTKALTAAHCLGGSTPEGLRVVAGLHRQADLSNTQISLISRFVQHEEYNIYPTLAALANDIAILHLKSAIMTDANIQYLTLPANNNHDFTGELCTITGWGYTLDSQQVPDILQQAQIPIISTTECSDKMQPIDNAHVWDKHICLYDRAEQKGACLGDSGGPLNCPDGQGGYYVAGITSFGITADRICQQSYPSVYTRTSSYLYWIFKN